MKNRIFLLLATLLFGALLMCSVQAEVAPDFNWGLSEDGTLTISGHGEMPEYTYSYDGTTPWDAYANDIHRAVIEEGITSISSFTFYDSYKGEYSNLMEIIIPDSVTHIGGAALFCTGWYDAQPDGPIYINNILYKYKGEMPENTSFTIPNSVTSIGVLAFSGCSGLTSITIPNSVTSIGDEAFGVCTGLTSITIPNSVTSIGGYAFSHCSGLTSITIPDSVTSIGDYAFRGCKNLSSITIPNSVTSIGGYAFWGTPWYDAQPDGPIYINNILYKYKGKMPENTRFTIPNSVTSIGSWAFDDCSGLTSITIPDSVTSIGDHAFISCSGLTNITIPNSVTSIGDYAFYGCSGLTSITIPDSVTSIGDYAFIYCTGLTSITIPNSVTSIGDDAFNGCSGLTSITIPNSVNSIGYGAFTGTPWIIAQPDGPIYINHILHAYKGVMPKNTSITIPNSVTSIGDYAFYGCTGLSSITIPNSVTSIGHDIFKVCDSLTDIYYTGTKEEWDSISIDSYNTRLAKATIHFNYTSVSEKPITVLLNAAPVSFPDQQPVIKDSRTLVPARGVFEALGATVGWDDATQTVTVERGETLVTLTIGESYITVNGERKEQDVPAQIVNSRTMIPVRAVAEAFACTVGWDGDTYTVIIDG